MKTVIIQYNAGNTTSVRFALNRLGIEADLSDDPQQILSADKVIFPGVGEAGSAMKFLKNNNLDVLIRNLKQPVLGICLGMQLMCSHSEEGDTEALGIFPVNVRRFVGNDEKVPHMGWNTISEYKGKLFRGLPDHAFVYYVHSFYAEKCADTSAVTEYILPFSASLEKNNFYGVQFHPEKSGVAGEMIIRNFMEL